MDNDDDKERISFSTGEVGNREGREGDRLIRHFVVCGYWAVHFHVIVGIQLYYNCCRLVLCGASTQSWCLVLISFVSSAAVSAQWPVEHANIALQNIMNEWTPHRVLRISLTEGKPNPMDAACIYDLGEHRIMRIKTWCINNASLSFHAWYARVPYLARDDGTRASTTPRIKFPSWRGRQSQREEQAR